MKVALEAAVEPAKLVGLAAAFRMGEDMGREVGRVSGGQAAAMAAAQELAKMNMAEITEEKALEELKPVFQDLGAKTGKDTGAKAGREAGATDDFAGPL